jgi:O-antigen/teichoic acid export membrane protein
VKDAARLGQVSGEAVKARKGLWQVFWALFNRGVGVVAQFLLNLLISRLFGTQGMGLYQIYSTWMVMLADIASMGLPVETMRRVSAWRARGRGQAIRAFVARALRNGTILAALVALPLLVFASEFAALLLNDAALDWLLLLAALAAVLFLGMRILAEAIKALGRTQIGILGESALLPLLLMLFIGASWLAGVSGDPQDLLLAHLGSLVLVFLALFLIWRRAGAALQDGEGEETQPGNRPPLHLWGSTLINAWYVNLPIFVLPYFADTGEIGVFGVAFRLVALATTILVSLASLFGPRFSGAYARADTVALARELRLSRYYSTLAYLPFFFAFTLFADPLLGLFGAEFRAGRDLLWVLALAQLVNAATGLVGYFLNMIHRDREEFLALVATTLLMLLLMPIGGYVYGVWGVTLAYAAGMIGKNLLSSFLAARYLRQMKLAQEGLPIETT